MNINKRSDSKRQQTTTVDYKRLINGLVLTSVVTLHRQTDWKGKTPPRGATRQIKLIHSLSKHTHIMSTMRNSVMLIGRPGAEPETRTFNDNRIVTRFNLAVNGTRRNANNEQVKDTQWFTVVAWDKTAERVALAVKKGKRIAVDGTLRNNEWIDKNGQRHLSTEIHMNNFILLDWGKEQND